MLSIVIPTQGRSSLRNAIKSCAPSIQKGSICDVLVVADSYQMNQETKNYIQDMIAVVNQQADVAFVRYAEFDAGYHDWGYPQLRQGYKFECDKFITNMGDDDQMIPGILPQMEYILSRNGNVPYLFQAILNPSPHRANTKPVTLWNDEDRSIQRKLVTGQNLIVPNIESMFTYMTDDFVFIEQTIKNWDGAVNWVRVPWCQCF